MVTLPPNGVALLTTEGEIMLSIGKPIGRSLMISSWRQKIYRRLYVLCARPSAAISWKVKLSQTACFSSQEAEYCALSEATKEALNHRMLMQELGFGIKKPTTIFCDNKGAITMGLHPSNKPTTRHIHKWIYICRQHVELVNVMTF